MGAARLLSRGIMATPSPSPAARARGCLLGLAAGHTLGLPPELRGTPEATGNLALALIQAEDLLEPEIDLERLALRWVKWRESDGRGLSPWTRIALDHVATHHSPPAESGGVADSGALPRTIPVALATAGSPANLVSGSFHLAHLLHPDARCGWGAVAVNVAVAWFLQGERDFIPEVLQALTANSAPDELVAAVRRVPLEKRTALPLEGSAPGSVVSSVEIALWLAYHERNLEQGLEWLVGAGGDDTNAAVAGALMGARDGEQAIPQRWLAEIVGIDRVRRIADRLAGSS